ncbi:MAG: tetratricopeptide repeat protein [Polyangia bacterium]
MSGASTLARVALALTLLGAVAAPAAARAGDKRAASSHFQKGRALFEAASYSAALEEFSAGYEAYPLAGFLVNIGQCQRKLDRLDDAAASFGKFLDSDVADPKLRAEVQEALAEISTERERRVAAEVEARRQRDEAERRHPVEEEVRSQRADLGVHAPARAALVAASPSSAPLAVEQRPQKSKKWVWAIVGVLAVGAAASAVAVGVIESQPQAARGGSLGLLDGRR